MVRRAKRTRRRKRVAIPTPGGSISVQFRRSKPGAPRCAICGSMVRGIPYSKIRKHTRSGRRPSRAYGGAVCPSCLAEALRREARGQA